MATLWNAADRRALVARLTPLTPSTGALWGTMNAAQMVTHCARAMRMALGDLPVAPKKTPLRYPGIKHLIIYVLPIPKGAPTARELKPVAEEADFAAERDAIGGLVERFGRCDPGGVWPEHPAFGSMSGRDWGTLAWKHLDHHFRQFGL